MKLSKQQFELIKELSHTSKNLYNSTLYITRQHFFQVTEFLSYNKAYHEVKNNENYKTLPSQVSQQTMKVVDRNFRSFFGLLRERKAGNYNRPISIPKYLDKKGYFVLLFTPAHFRINYENKTVKFTCKKNLLKKYNLTSFTLNFPHYLNKDQKIKEIRIIPLYKGKFFKLEVVYLNKIDENSFIETNENCLSIDLGINNLLTIYDSKNQSSKIIDGKFIKSVNRYFDKEIANAKSVVEKVNKQKTSRKIQKLWQKREDIFSNAFHLISKRLIEYCIINNISNIIIGYNKEWKQDVNLGTHNNQNFVQIPYGKLLNYIKYKAQDYNIKVTLIEESYTSKCDALANEEIKKQEEYLGKRIHRGLFLSSTGQVINADVNAAINIYRKCNLEFFERRIESSGIVIVPTKIRPESLANFL